MEHVAEDSRAIASASDPPPRAKESPSLPVRLPSPPMRFVSLEEVWGRQESPNKVRHAKGNDGDGAVSEPEKKRAALEEEDGMTAGEDDVRPHRAKRCRFQIFDDDETEDDELVVLQLVGTDPKNTQEDEVEGGAVERPSSLRASAVKKPARCRSSSLWSDDDETEDGSADFQASDEDFVPSQQDLAPTPATACDQDAPIDERMMHAVIARRVRSRRPMTDYGWNLVASELGDERLQTGNDVRKRVRELAALFKSEPAGRDDISAPLRALLARYTRSRKSISAPNPKAPKHRARSQASPARVKASKNLVRSQASPASAVARGENSARKLGGRAMAIKVASDELLVQLVLEHRAGLTTNGAMMETWQLVADTLSTKFVHFKSGQTAKSRFECLLGAYEDPKHIGQASLTRSIRVLLDEFTKVSADDQYQLLLRIVEEKSCGTPRIREDTIDDLLLREVLRSRPFHSKAGDRTAAWNRVAVRLNSTQYSSGKSCKLRVQTLLRLARAIHGGSPCGLTTKQQVRLYLIDSAMAWHSMSSQRLHHAYGESLLQVDEMVEKRFAIDVQPDRQATTEIASSCDDGTSITISERCSQRSDDGCRSRTVEPTSNLRDARHRTETLSDVSTQDRQPKGQLLAPMVSTVSPVIAHTDPERAREEQRGDIKSLLEMIKTERETHHRETSAMLALIQQDRVDRRDEFLAMMELIKGVITRPSP